MESLHDLIQSLAKEEKRLYSVHGRKARFTSIYEAYLDAPQYSRDLDRVIFDKHFSTFSKAYYSMQKTDLLDDLLGVLLEYSNSRSEAFSAIRIRSKFEVLRHKGFHSLAAEYLQNRMEGLKAHLPVGQYLSMLEDLRDTLPHCPEVTWDQFARVENEVEETRQSHHQLSRLEEPLRRLNVLIASATHETKEENKMLAAKEFGQLRAIANEEPGEAADLILFEAELRFRRSFESKFDVHQFLVRAEKQLSEKSAKLALRMKVLNLLLESCMDTGDFLLINGLTYKTQKEIPNLNAEEKKEFLPTFYELNALYQFYENDLPRAQHEMMALIALPGHSEATLRRLNRHKIAMLIAANLPRAAQEALNEYLTAFPEEKNILRTRYTELIIAIEFNQQPEVKASLQRLKVTLRKLGRVKESLPGRKFLDLVEKIISRTKSREPDYEGLGSTWRDPLKVNLWLKGKMDNNFYYNLILKEWQDTRKVLPAERVSVSAVL
jgi:hypothetical protein